MEIEFFFDVGSPYTYLAAHQVDDFAASLGITAVWRPFLLGGVFKATGNTPPAMLPARGKYMWNDLNEWASYKSLPLLFPKAFPTNSLYAQRAVIAAEQSGGQAACRAATLALFDAYWGRGEDVAELPVVQAALVAAGLDAEAIMAGMSEDAVKATLRTNTDDAVARGAFGAPTFFVGDRMFFGNDRFELMAHYIRSAQ